MIRRCLAALAVCWFLTSALFSQEVLSNQATASLWTVGPGKELYAAFGHTALRITDPVIGFDRLYNFGTFDFATPNFYLKFIRGDLDYYLTAAVAPEVLEEYAASHQLVIEQRLNLSSPELDALFLAMEENLRPEKAAYRYDFIRDNCTTRIRDAIARIAPVKWAPLADSHPTLREMVQPYVADRRPIQAGINLMFGANMDHSADAREAMFLPEDMRRAFDRATILNNAEKRPLVGETTTLLPGISVPAPAPDWLAPLSWALALLGLFAAWRKWNFFYFLDVPLFCIAGLIGCVLLFCWVGTRHWVLHQNWNLLWAIPLHLIIWFFPKRIQRPYWLLTACLIFPGLLFIKLVPLGIPVFLAIRAFARSRRLAAT